MIESNAEQAGGLQPEIRCGVDPDRSSSEVEQRHPVQGKQENREAGIHRHRDRSSQIRLRALHGDKVTIIKCGTSVPLPKKRRFWILFSFPFSGTLFNPLFRF